MHVKISSYSKKGHGLASCEEKKKKIQVMSAVIGDLLEIKILHKRKGAYVSEILSIIQPSADRVEPKCPHAEYCGGCTWQQLQYKKQLAEKEKRIIQLFDAYREKIPPVFPSPEIWHYRNKMEFSFSEDKEGRPFLGLIAKGSKGRVMNLAFCELVDPMYMRILAEVRKWWRVNDLKAYRPNRDVGSLRTLTVRNSRKNNAWMVFLTVSGNPRYALTREQIKNFKDILLHILPVEKTSIFLRIQSIAKGMETQFYEMHLHGPAYLHETLHVNHKQFHFYLSPASFFQPNSSAAEILFAKALEAAAPSSSDQVLDLYCGTGAFGMIFSPYVKNVIGIESNPYAVFDARLNLEENGIKNMQVHQGDVGEVLKKLQGASTDLAIVDPPRIGLSPEAVRQLKKIKPKKILYVSCHPESQSDDVQQLLDNYEISFIQPVDQFPHTPHIENILLLVRREVL
ncbi:MAG: 23S rRNA (uracil(1939)-C(5))-methyltransferase RlmD [Simkaniaceae bacterium]